MSRAALFLFCVALVDLVTLTGCRPDAPGCFTPAGEQVLWTFEHLWTAAQVPHTLQMEDRVDVVWHEDVGWPRVEVWGAEGVIGGVRVEVLDGVLSIRDEGRCHGVRDLTLRPTVEIWHPGFTGVLAAGQGDFTMADTARVGYFHYEGKNMSGDAALLYVGDSLLVLQRAGVGEVALAGSARWGSLYLNGYGGLDARACTLSTALIHHDGIGDLQVFAPNYAFVALRNAGDCFVYGDPEQLDVDDQGAGEVLRVE
jgi:hypothetical protein